MSDFIIQGVNFLEMDFMRYWSFPSSYSKEKKQIELNKILYSDDYIASEKKDGYAQLIIKNNEGQTIMRSRNKGVNDWICKHEWVPHLQSFFDSLPNGTVLLGEVYLPNKTSKSIVSILGCLKEKAIARQIKDEDKLRLYIFDVLAYNNILTYTNPMDLRIQQLGIIESNYSINDKLKLTTNFVEFAKYWTTPEEIRENWLRIIAEGGEGVVLTRKDYPYEFKKRTARKTLKLKKELEETIDVFLTGRWKEATYNYTGHDVENWQYWYNRVTEEKVFGKMSDNIAINEMCDPVSRLWYNGWAGSVEIALMNEDKIQPIGWISGVKDEIKSGIVEDPSSFKGKVAELNCMEIDRSDSIPTLRHGRIIRWRDDKDYTNCNLEQIL